MADASRQNALGRAAVAAPFEWRAWVHAGIALFLLSAVLIVVQRELADLSARDVLAYLRSIPRNALATALALTVASYAFLSVFDVLGLRYIGRQVPYRKIAFTSFLAYAVSHNLGAGAVTGGAVRYKLYSGAGLKGVEIATLQGFCSLTTMLGLAVLFGASLLFAPEYAAAALHLFQPWTIVLGLASIGGVAAYMTWGHFGRRELRLRSWVLRPPGEMIAVMQVGVGVVEMAAKAAVLWWLLPPDANVSFLAFLGAYALAVGAGIVSYIPGGLGVFESVILFALPQVPPTSLLGALLAYRLIYYLLPLMVAGVVFAAREMKKHVSGPAEGT